MTPSLQPTERILPIHAWEEVLSVPIIAFAGTRSGSAYYETLGLTFLNGITLNLSSPGKPFPSDRTTTLADFQDDHTDEDVDRYRIAGHSLKNLIYHPECGFPQYYAVLDDHHYLSAHSEFNYTQFSYGSFSAWRSGGRRRLSWAANDLTKQQFFNGWTHERINPFAVYR